MKSDDKENEEFDNLDENETFDNIESEEGIIDNTINIEGEVVSLGIIEGEVIENSTESDNGESKHKIKGKHSLSHDSIFKGKKKLGENSPDDEFSQDFLVPKQENFDFDSSSAYHEETKDPEEYVRLKKLKEEIYVIIINKTDINIKNSRRKPGRVDFNKYYQVLVNNLDTSTYNFGEIFIELSFYFSDNIFNMFKLLDKKWGGKIIKELAKKRNIKIDKMDFF